MLVVRQMVEAGSKFPVAMLAHSAPGDLGMRDPRMHRCVAHTFAVLTLDFMKFELSEEDFPDLLVRLPARFVVQVLKYCIGFISKHSIT